MTSLCRTLGILAGGVCLLGVTAAAQDAPRTAAAALPKTAPPATAALQTQAPEEPEENLITMDFQGVDLPVLIKFISEVTGRNFIIDERVKGKITIISPSKITVEEAYQVFLSVLQVKNFTTVPAGAITKIVPAQEAKSSTVPTILPGLSHEISDAVITKLMPLEYVDAANIVSLIQPLISPNGLLATYAATNSLILIDSAANIDRISKIIGELDVPGSERGVEVIRLNYAFATEIAGVLAQVLEEPPSGATTTRPGTRQPPRRTARPPRTGRAARTARAAQTGAAAVTAGGTGERAYKIIPDERTNALIVVAGTLEMRRIKDLIVRLDVPLPMGTGRIRVYYLKYANAFEIVPVLSDLIGSGGGGVGGLTGGLLSRSISGSSAYRGGRLGQRGGLGGGSGTRGFSGGGRSGSYGGGGLSRGQRGGYGGGGFGGGFGGRAGATGGVASVTGGGQGQFQGEVRITADPSTNALIIYASPQDFETLKSVIELLDVRRRQVFVEAIIMEVRITTSRSLGIELQGGAGLGQGAGLGRVNFGNLAAFNANPASLAGLPGLVLAAASNQTVRLPDGTVVPAQTALLLAAESDTDINLLSAPTILTTDNQEAEIVVGQNIPFIASTATSDINLSNTFATVDRRDVGITLRITPQISDGGLVRLDIFQEVSALIPSAVGGMDPNLVGPSTTIRSATTTVVVHNNQTVVIGGLISDDITNAESKVPFLGDLPVLGNLFKTETSDRGKINLLIFLTPHIILNAAQHRDTSVEKRDQLKGFMEEYDFPNRRHEQLDAPSWEPVFPEKSPEDETREDPDTVGTHWSRPDTSAAARMNERNLPPTATRYALLAAFAERGSPPESLKTASGLLAVKLPEDSKLTALFEKNGEYRFHSDTYEALYRCLEAYSTAREALLIYPEGLPVDPEHGEYLHWRKLQDALSSNIASWSKVD